MSVCYEAAKDLIWFCLAVAGVERSREAQWRESEEGVIDSEK
jgi:hypothetical protein